MIMGEGVDNQAAGKRCVACGADLSDAGRMKDLRGRYVCLVCAEKLRQMKIRRRRAERAAQNPDQTGGMDSTLDHELLDDFLELDASDRLYECPRCMQEMRPDATVCARCGYDVAGRRVERPSVITALNEAGVVVPGFLERRRTLRWGGLVYIAVFGVLPIADAALMRNFYLVPMGVGMVLAASVVVLAYDMVPRVLHRQGVSSRARVILLGLLLFPAAAVSAMFETVSRGRDRFMRTLAWANLYSLLFVLIAVGVDVYLRGKELGG